MSSPRARFARHYLEMVVVMFAGMLVLGAPAELAMRALGTSSTELMTDAPAVAFLSMALSMTLPMVWVMRRRGHGWRPCLEMAASMVVPTLVAIVVLAADTGVDAGALMGYEHAVMLVSMLGVMLARFDEYAGCDHAAHDQLGAARQQA